VSIFPYVPDDPQPMRADGRASSLGAFEGLGAGNLLALVRFGQPTHCTMDGLDGDDGHRHRSAGDRLIDTLSALPYQFQLKCRALVEDQIIDLTVQIVSAVAGRNPRQTLSSVIGPSAAYPSASESVRAQHAAPWL
jgi:hypothetical protein